jgi:curved DNA-binding protein
MSFAVAQPMEFKDYYKILGVADDASEADVKRAYRKLARKYHPDVSDEPDAQAKFQEVGEAYEVLKDPEKRAAYDQIRAGGYDPESFSRQFGDREWQFRGGGFTGANSDAFSDFFNAIFGGGGGEDVFGGAEDIFSGAFGAGARRGGRGFSAPGQDLRYRLDITLEEAFNGGEREISFSLPEQIEGRTQEKRKTLRVKIPAGVTEGREIRLRGQGSPGIQGGPSGNLLLEIHILDHPHFVLDGANVVLNVPITPAEAALGADIQVPTLGGKVSVKVPAGTSSGKRLRLRGRGLPGEPPGDQFLIFKVVVPSTLSPKEKELYQALGRESSTDVRSGLSG